MPIDFNDFVNPDTGSDIPFFELEKCLKEKCGAPLFRTKKAHRCGHSVVGDVLYV